MPHTSRRSPMLVAALVLVVGCAGEEPESGELAVEGAVCPEVVNVGFSGPLSGGAAFYGENVLNGIRMAVDEINAEGGLEVGGRPVRLQVVALDDRYLPNETGTNVRRLQQQSGAPLVFVPHVGGALAVQPMAAREPGFVLAAYTSDPRILEAGSPMTVMIPPRYDNYAAPFVEATSERFGSRLAMVPTTSSYGKAWTEMVSEEWTARGGTVTGDFGVDYNTTTDFTSAVTQALATRPDVLFIGGPSQPTALVVKAAREQGFEGGFIVMDQAKFEEMDDIVPLARLEGAVGIYPLESYPGPGTAQFLERFRGAYGSEAAPTSEVGLNYQAMRAFGAAIEMAGCDPVAIRTALPEAAGRLPDELRPYPLSEVTEQGHMVGDVIAAEVRGGEYVPLPVPAERI